MKVGVADEFPNDGDVELDGDGEARYLVARVGNAGDGGEVSRASGERLRTMPMSNQGFRFA